MSNVNYPIVSYILLAYNQQDYISQAMGTDYFPRLTSVINDKDSTIDLIRRQTELLVIIGIVPILLVFSLSDVAITVLYSVEFLGAGLLLKMIILSDFFKLLAWPMGFALLAKGKSFLFAGKEVVILSIFLLLVYIFFKEKLFIVGLGYIAMRIVNFFALLIITNNLVGFKYSKTKFLKYGMFALLLIGLFIIHFYNELIAQISALAFACYFGVIAFNNVKSILLNKI